MLHELVHMRHSAHNVEFYKLLDELVVECEKLMAHGITGSMGKGVQLNPNSSNRNTKVNSKELAAKAALRRFNQPKGGTYVLGGNGAMRSGGTSGGYKLGTSSSSDATKTKRNVVGSLRDRMLSAANRRRADAVSCGSLIDGISVGDKVHDDDDDDDDNRKKKEVKEVAGPVMVSLIDDDDAKVSTTSSSNPPTGSRKRRKRELFHHNNKKAIELANLRIVDLKEKLKANGLKLSGSKQELIDRLVAFDESDEEKRVILLISQPSFERSLLKSMRKTIHYHRNRKL